MEELRVIVDDAKQYVKEIIERNGEKELVEYDGEKAFIILFKSATRLERQHKTKEEWEARGPRQILNITIQDAMGGLPAILKRNDSLALKINLEYILITHGRAIEVDYKDGTRSRFNFGDTKESLSAGGPYRSMSEEHAVEFVNWLGRKAGVIS